jgi:hypothetical protein
MSTQLIDAFLDAQRDTKGQFKPGNKGGPGNPFAGKVAHFRTAVLECVTDEDLHGIVKSLVQMAKDGHWQAAKLILSYAIGKPGSLPEPSSDAFELPFANPPSTNGEFMSASPSTNGHLQPAAPPPSDDVPEPAPSANGNLPSVMPLPNGILQPALNRKERRALRKAERLAKSKRNTPPPVTAPLPNGITASS